MLGKIKRLLFKLRFLRTVYLRRKHGRSGPYIALAEALPGWTRGGEAIALMQVCQSLPPDAVVVEVGSFLGGSTVLLAGARELCGSGMVHSVDPFDASGDAFSAPVYQDIAGAMPATLRQRFDENIRRAALTPRVVVHQGTAEAVAQEWNGEIDMLFLDGDQSPQGARSAYEHWVPFLKAGGIIALHNSSDREYAEGHDGHRRLAVEALNSPEYAEVRCVGSTTFARKLGASPHSPGPTRVPGTENRTQ